MSGEIYYNIHDILKIKIKTENEKYLFPEFNFPFYAFMSKPLSDVDIELNIGLFKPNFRNTYPVSVDYNFYAGDNYFYIRDFEGRLGRFVWDIEIMGIEEGKTTINFNAKMPFKIKIGYPDLLPQLLLLKPLLYYKLAQKNALFMHAAGMQKDGKAFVLAGRGGSYKTSLLMDLVRKFGWESLGDEHIVISNSNVLSFHSFPRIFQYSVSKLKSEKFPKIDKVKFVLSMIRNKYINVINSTSPLKAVFILHRKNTNRFKLTEIEPSYSIKKLYYNNLCEWFAPGTEFHLGIKPGRFFEYISMYSFANPLKNVDYFWKEHLKLLEKLVSKVTIYSIEIPRYSVEIAKEFNNTLENNF